MLLKSLSIISLSNLRHHRFYINLIHADFYQVTVVVVVVVVVVLKQFDILLTKCTRSPLHYIHFSIRNNASENLQVNIDASL